MNAGAAIDLDVVRNEPTAPVLSDALDQEGPAPPGPRCWADPAGPRDGDRRVRVSGKHQAGLPRAGEPVRWTTDIAVWGELLSTVCISRGAVSAITDGPVRDARAKRELDFPVISGGTIPYDSLGRHEIVAMVCRA